MSLNGLQNWLQTRDQHETYILDVMSKHFNVCQADVKKIMTLVSKHHGVHIPNGNSHMDYIQRVAILLQARDKALSSIQ
jgi:hypothetical protein